MKLLESLREIVDGFKDIGNIIPWFGYLLISVLGGAAAFVKEWEDKDPNRTWRQNFWALWRKTFFALIAGVMWYHIVVWQSMIGSPLSYIGAILVGLYAPEFIDLIWKQMRKRLGKDLDQTDKDNSSKP